MADSSCLAWFKVLVLIMIAFVAGLAVANIVYFNRIRQGGIVAPSEANSMLILNIITLVAAIIIFAIALWLVFSHRSKIPKVTKQITTEVVPGGSPKLPPPIPTVATQV